MKDCRINVLPTHSCSTIKTTVVCCLDDHGKILYSIVGCVLQFLLVGMEHSCSVLCCDCEPLSLTLVRARLWPATPQFPKYAFSFDLLDWAEALLLECHVSLKDFCEALYYRCPYEVLEVNLY